MSIATSVVHRLSAWEAVANGISVRRCTNCREVQFVRHAGDTSNIWHHEGDRIRVHGNGFRERTEGPVTCEAAA
jgi:hypothetical protein